MTTSILFHLLPLAAYRAEPDSPVTSPTLDNEGFVHCSADLDTTVAVANDLHRDSEEPMVALEIDATALTSPVRWEEAVPAPPAEVSSETLFPHVYGAIDRAAICRVHHARRDARGQYLGFEQRGPSAEELDLLPHPEGGWYRRTWASSVTTRPGSEQAAEKSDERPTATAIYFLLPAGEGSDWHTVASDELWLWHRGGPLVLTCAGDGPRPGSEQETITLGPDLAAGQVPQAVVPAGHWQRADASAETETLVSCVVSPGFDFADFRTL